MFASKGGGIGARLLDRLARIMAEFLIFIKSSRPVLLYYDGALFIPEYFSVGRSFNVTPAFICYYNKASA